MLQALEDLASLFVPGNGSGVLTVEEQRRDLARDLCGCPRSVLVCEHHHRRSIVGEHDILRGKARYFTSMGKRASVRLGQDIDSQPILCTQTILEEHLGFEIAIGTGL